MMLFRVKNTIENVNSIQNVNFSMRSKFRAEKIKCLYLLTMQHYRHVEVKLPLDDDPMKTYLTLEMNDDVDNGLVEMMSAIAHWLGIDVPIECVA